MSNHYAGGVSSRISCCCPRSSWQGKPGLWAGAALGGVRFGAALPGQRLDYQCQSGLAPAVNPGSRRGRRVARRLSVLHYDKRSSSVVSLGCASEAVGGRIPAASLHFSIIRTLYHILETSVLVAVEPRHRWLYLPAITQLPLLKHFAGMYTTLFWIVGKTMTSLNSEWYLKTVIRPPSLIFGTAIPETWGGSDSIAAPAAGRSARSAELRVGIMDRA